MIQRLASLGLTFVAIVLLITCFVTGSFMADAESLRQIMRQMDNELVMTWLPKAMDGHPMAVVWLAWLCAVGALLFINQGCCLWTRWFSHLRSRLGRRQLLLLVAHLLFALIMLGHASSLFIGFKDGNFRLAPGQTRTLANGLAVELLQVEFVSDRELLTTNRGDTRLPMSSERFDRTKNRALVRLSKDERELSQGWVYMLQPLRHGFTRVTLRQFNLPKDDPEGPIGVMLTVSTNPFHELFFAAYALLIADILAYLGLTWRPNGSLKTSPNALRDTDVA